MSDLDKAREWAAEIAESRQTNIRPDAFAVAKIIQSLPDHWVDAEKVREIIEEMDHCLKMESTTDFSMGIDNATTSWRDALKALLTPKPQTLWHLIEAGNQPEEYKFMQCSVAPWGGAKGVIFYPGSSRSSVVVEAGGVADLSNAEIIPLPDLPKLQWPSNAPQEPYLFGGTSSESDLPDISVSERIERTVDQQSNTSETPKSSINPDDVPPNEPWLIEVDNVKAIGTRYADYAVSPWSVADLNGSCAHDYNDSDVTLIHKLVPEPPALPEGMRLADHKEYGRVVVSPKPDRDGDYKIFLCTSEEVTGADWEYAHEIELTFLDGVDA